MSPLAAQFARLYTKSQLAARLDSERAALARHLHHNRNTCGNVGAATAVAMQAQIDAVSAALAA